MDSWRSDSPASSSSSFPLNEAFERRNPKYSRSAAYTSESSRPQEHPLVRSIPVPLPKEKIGWRSHGTNIAEGLEAKRQVSSIKCGSSATLHVRVISAEKRSDVSGAPFTAYVIRVVHNGREQLMERRYSEFHNLHVLFKKHQIRLNTSFPGKHWAGRVGNWTPSVRWAPESHEDLVSYRVIQLDVWLVHAVEKHNSGDLPEQVSIPVIDFLTCPEKPPCDRINHEFGNDEWKWNNPFSFTLGSSIRQATYTVQHMCRKSNILHDFDHSIPLDLLQAAKGLCFLTVFKAGMVVSGRVGTGLVVCRLENDCSGKCMWSAPCALGTMGMGWGAQVGGDVTHYLVVLTTTQAVKDLVANASVQLGAELGVAVGPVGRSANSQLQTGDWKLHSAYSYAHSQGFFVGISLEGSVVTVRNDVNAKFYGKQCQPEDLLQQTGPKAAEPLYQALEIALKEEIPEGAFRPSQYLSPSSRVTSSKPTDFKSTAVLVDDTIDPDEYESLTPSIMITPSTDEGS